MVPLEVLPVDQSTRDSELTTDTSSMVDTSITQTFSGNNTPLSVDGEVVPTQQVEWYVPDSSRFKTIWCPGDLLRPPQQKTSSSSSTFFVLFLFGGFKC